MLFGGEEGIRTLDTPRGIYTLSKRAPSTTRTPLLAELFYYTELRPRDMKTFDL